MQKYVQIIKNTLVSAVLCALFLLNFNLRQCTRNPSATSVVHCDTVKVIDTIIYYKPVPRDSIVIRYVTEKLPVTPAPEDITVPIIPDSVEVKIPITQKKYETDNYTAYVSGYNPTLDSLLIKLPRTVIKEEVQTFSPRKKWSVGVQVGYGVTVNKTPQFTPYIGIGVTYNLFSF